MAKPKNGQLWRKQVQPYARSPHAGYEETYFCFSADSMHIKMKNVETGDVEEFIEMTDDRWRQRSKIKDVFIITWSLIQ